MTHFYWELVAISTAYLIVRNTHIVFVAVTVSVAFEESLLNELFI